MKKPSGHFRNLSSASGRFLAGRARCRSSSDGFRSQQSASASALAASSPPNLRKLSRSDAQWFVELPDELPETVQRKHFSREERILLASRRDSATSDVASLYRRSFDSDIQRARDEVRRSFRWIEDDADFNIQLQLHKFSEQRQQQAPSPPHSRSQSQSQAPSQAQSQSQSRRPPPPSPSSAAGPKRTASLTSKGRRTHTSSSSSACTARSRHSLGTRRAAAGAAVPSALACPRNTHSADSEATYYQDPEARLKLRVYLASPQKFDEAVEFGFPSQAEADLFKPLASRTAAAVGEMRLHEVDLDARSTTATTTTATSTTATDTTDVADVAGATDATTTTTDTTDTTNTADHTTAAVKPLTAGIGGGGCAAGDQGAKIMPGMREMTLRMTLTRKDLRAYNCDDDAGGCGREPMLTAEGRLPPENEHAAHRIDWAAIDREAESGLKRLWRRVKRH